jgi:hypothetical protein
MIKIGKKKTVVTGGGVERVEQLALERLELLVEVAAQLLGLGARRALGLEVLVRLGERRGRLARALLRGRTQRALLLRAPHRRTQLLLALRCTTLLIIIHIHTYRSRFIPKGVAEVSQIFLRETHADVTGGKPIAVLSYTILKPEITPCFLFFYLFMYSIACRFTK